MEKVFDYVIECSGPKGRISYMNVTEDSESRRHKAVTFLVERGKERQGMERATNAEGAPGRSTEEKGREEGEEGEESEQRQEKTRSVKK